jgi:hypothetical protein
VIYTIKRCRLWKNSIERFNLRKVTLKVYSIIDLYHSRELTIKSVPPTTFLFLWHVDPFTIPNLQSPPTGAQAPYPWPPDPCLALLTGHPAHQWSPACQDPPASCPACRRPRVPALNRQLPRSPLAMHAWPRLLATPCTRLAHRPALHDGSPVHQLWSGNLPSPLQSAPS